MNCSYCGDLMVKVKHDFDASWGQYCLHIPEAEGYFCGKCMRTVFTPNTLTEILEVGRWE